MASARLATAIHARALMRMVESDGGFAVIARRGDPVGGDLTIIVQDRSGNSQLLLRQPQLDGSHRWAVETRFGTRADIDAFLDRRARQDPDLWIIELDVADAERLIVMLAQQD